MPLIINREESAWIIEAKGNAQQFVEIEHFPWYRERSDDGTQQTAHLGQSSGVCGSGLPAVAAAGHQGGA